ncbi:MAG: Diacylglycerol kinase [Candidatus Moranbacteria bacterium GW2011_GWE2_35_2-]|nr:MAG: Diacylglycerol kinase [Candidatus Moranbacteria bacterium GW2011_GWE2_35_2-]KKQ04802.1 MAG: Diacylglycerol kinase [Candidatus Moranbacteria bacterium GW2011_GWF1_36_4]KKQ22989.1 MAG: Diacylglycerol kinase [Candidatus Moranbacteria bacterium GW2011_GWF2_37_11]KKQ29347.1 MAG: Diacylglycerol kinase [Candidatus Moranbacteria bacterium GW2011_GWD1_37_17]KKQ30780.1 MAG: Diacylglycerol kinase [Candidatus Moranbacteria bacterium GW2011_GWE1_37_24]KKQ46858.1 MAG: Diacylglycerol kinase [Candidat
MKQENRIRNFRKSLSHAARGFFYAFKNERNFQIELLAAVAVLFLIWYFKIKNWEAIILVLMIMWVLVAELINTVMERVVDMLKPRIHPYARLIKDIMAAVVLISSVVALVVGIIIFLPYLRDFSNRF